MERRDQLDRDMQSSMNYSNPPLKLPLAPLISSSTTDRRINPAVSNRRGSSIFSPTQILDHQNQSQPPPHLRRLLNPPPPPPFQQIILQKEPTPDPDPVSTPSNSKAPAAQLPQVASSPPPVAEESTVIDNSTSSVKYRECLKNHAAGIGGHVVDGCGEFMAGGEEGSPEALKCAACDCHRNFHRKEIEGDTAPQSHFHPYNSGNIPRLNHPVIHGGQNTPPLALPRHQHHKPPAMVMNFGGVEGRAAAAESTSEDLDMFPSGGVGHADNYPPPSVSPSKKRFRSKFSQEQKDRMQEFAEKLEWRIQKQDDERVIGFCSQIGVKRKVFKVWMHNNKQSMKRPKDV